MKELYFPFDGNMIMRRRKALKKQLLADGTTRIKKKIAVLGGSTTDDVVTALELFLLNFGIEPQFYQSEYNKFYEDAVFGSSDFVEFKPDLILAIGGGSVMDVSKGLHLFYENPDMTFEESLKPFALPELGKLAISVFVPTTSGTGSETSSAAVFINEKTHVKSLLLSNTLIPDYTILDADLTDRLPRSVQISTGLDALCHAIESTTARNTNDFTRAIATQSALDILEYLPIAADGNSSDQQRRAAKEKLHMAATMAGIAITNSFTGIVHSYDHPGPEFGIPHGIVCGIMLPYSMEMVGPTEEYACIARRLGYTGSTAELSKALMRHITKLNSRLGLSESFSDAGIDKERYFANVPRWSEISLNAMATKLSPANMDVEKGKKFYTLCYYGSKD